VQAMVATGEVDGGAAGDAPHSRVQDWGGCNVGCCAARDGRGGRDRVGQQTAQWSGRAGRMSRLRWAARRRRPWWA
jgi:hypothetical protein